MVQKIKFQWYFDFSTSADSMQIITVSAGGQDVVERLKPFFGAYKQYKLGSVQASLVPASTLPIDPTGLSYEAGENTVDPRDQLNPGLTRITNGEDFIDDLTGFTDQQINAIYEAMVVDTRWYKWSLQSGLKRKAYPKYWQIGQLHQDYFPGATVNVPRISSNDGFIQGTNSRHLTTTTAENYFGSNALAQETAKFSDPRGFFQTGHKGTLGWMPTDALAQYATSVGVKEHPAVAPIPSIELFKIITPKAHKTVYYYRCYVTETVYFRMPVTSQTIMPVGSSGMPGVMLDRFIYGLVNRAVDPRDSLLAQINPPNDGEGGEDNHGSD
nr:MAG: capsid protein [ssDNA virus sp.]